MLAGDNTETLITAARALEAILASTFAYMASRYVPVRAALVWWRWGMLGDLTCSAASQWLLQLPLPEQMSAAIAITFAQGLWLPISRIWQEHDHRLHTARMAAASLAKSIESIKPPP